MTTITIHIYIYIYLLITNLFSTTVNENQIQNDFLWVLRQKAKVIINLKTTIVPNWPNWEYDQCHILICHIYILYVYIPFYASLYVSFRLTFQWIKSYIEWTPVVFTLTVETESKGHNQPGKPAMIIFFKLTFQLIKTDFWRLWPVLSVHSKRN